MPSKATLGQLHRQKVLMENLALRERARHLHELPRSVEPHGFVPQGSKVTEIAAGSTTKIEDGIRRIALYRIEERGVILADIMVSRALPESPGEPIIIRDRRVREAPDLLRVIPSACTVHRASIRYYVARLCSKHYHNRRATVWQKQTSVKVRCRRGRVGDLVRINIQPRNPRFPRVQIAGDQGGGDDRNKFVALVRACHRVYLYTSRIP